MSDKIIKVSVEEEYIKAASRVLGARGSHNDVFLELSFSPLWEGTTKRVTWFDALGQNPVETLLTTPLLKPGETNVYLVPVPPEAKAESGEMQLTIRGTVLKGDGVLEKKAVVGASVTFTVLPAKFASGAGAPADVTAAQAVQLQAEIDTIKVDIVDAKAGAAAAKEAIAAAKAEADKAAADAVKTAADAAKTDADAAKTAADRLTVESAAGAEAGRVTAETAREAGESARSTAENQRVAQNAAESLCEPYDPLQDYVIGNKVVQSGSTYRCLASCRGIAPPENSKWLLIAAKGADGQGRGDMLADIYDPTGRKTDIFAFAAADIDCGTF